MFPYHEGLNRAHKERLMRIAAAAYKRKTIIPIIDHTPEPEPIPVMQPLLLSIDLIQGVVARAYDFTVADLKGPARTELLARARLIGYWLTRKLVMINSEPASFPWIGRQFNRSDHTTILSGVRKIEEEREDPDFAAYLDGLVSKTEAAVAGGGWPTGYDPPPAFIRKAKGKSSKVLALANCIICDKVFRCGSHNHVVCSHACRLKYRRTVDRRKQSAPVSKLRVATTEPSLATLRDALPHEEPETGADL